MARTLDFFLFIGSTYTYLAVNRAEAAAARAGIALRWRPFSARTIMLEQNNRPFVGKPVKMTYMWRDLERRAERHGVPFAAIPPYPIDMDERANRVATLAADEGWCPAFTRAIYAQWFLEGRTPAPRRLSPPCCADWDATPRPSSAARTRTTFVQRTRPRPMRRARWAFSVRPRSRAAARSSGATTDSRMRSTGARRIDAA